MKKQYVYLACYGWIWTEKIVEFKSLKKAIEFLEAQNDDCWYLHRALMGEPYNLPSETVENCLQIQAK